MVSITALVCVGILASAVTAQPHRRHMKKFTVLEARQASGAVCGSDSYTSANIAAAQKAGCQYENEGKTVGTDKYPHQYNDYEKFNFTTPSPWYEFPIMDSHQLFTGSGSPGADRVIFNKACELTGVITHTGASGDDFLMCKYDSAKQTESDAWGM